MADKNEPVIVFSGNVLEADMVKSMLEAENIRAFLRDETLGSLAPFMTSPGGSGAVKVVVARQDEDRARALVDEFLTREVEEITDWNGDDT